MINMGKLKLAEAWPVGEFIREELEVRNWTTLDLAIRIGGTIGEIGINKLATDMLIAVPEARIDQETAEGYARAFGVSAEMFMNLDRTYHEWCADNSINA